MKIIFMGSGNFAFMFLKALLASHHDVSCIFTSPEKPSGRGLEISKSKILALAEKNNITFHTPTSFKKDEVRSIVEDTSADVVVVCSYGFLLPEYVLLSKKYGAINVHPSALPKFRGAAPMQHTILSGDEKSAVCIMQMDKGLDTGDILLKEEFDVGDMDYIELFDFCVDIGPKLLLKALDEIDSLVPVAQDSLDVSPSYASKINKADGLIDWSCDAASICRKVKAFVKWPGAYFFYDSMQIKVLKAQYEDVSTSFVEGTVINDNCEIATRKGIFKPLILQREGRKPLSIEEFKKGFRIKSGSILSS
ncbi:methionyl-tRNA formyltransferase [Candidatus Sneabacter namystus]|uniref:Methionyl-tRNA formyltransferase n=1 Tax=Candidatus Sneabacter namystus TaxID=2601646 RepID=A0A5C0UJF6_9RICK|nr:methionyl-tRNA formyltransferase [Candidatus Sneabacter namystus]QEK39643.1 methionyl-tRNA formyltransferase [Candidatus Sneabacter namystus]